MIFDRNVERTFRKLCLLENLTNIPKKWKISFICTLDIKKCFLPLALIFSYSWSFCKKKIDTIYDGENNDPIKEEKDVAPIGFYYLRKCTLCRLKSIPSITMHRKALQIDTSVFRSIVFI